jgi:hypothetical protein
VRTEKQETKKMAGSYEFSENLSASNPGRKMTAGEVAEIIGVDAKTFRAWMRKQTTVRAGSGNRWAITEFDAQKLVYLYDNRKAPTVFRLNDNIDLSAMLDDDDDESEDFDAE